MLRALLTYFTVHKPQLISIANACVESFIRPPLFNAFDLYNFAFHDFIMGPVTPETLTEKHDPSWIYTTIDPTQTHDEWKEKAHHKTKMVRGNFELVTIYDADGNSIDTDNAIFVPRETWKAMAPLVNATNNVAIVFHSIQKLGTPVSEEVVHKLRVYGWYLHQVVDFCMYACDVAWQENCMMPQFVPFDLYEYIDLFFRINTHLPATLERVGYQNRYEVPWNPLLGRSNLTSLAAHAKTYWHI